MCDADERMEDSSLCSARPGDACPLYYEIQSKEASASRHALTFAPLACLRSTRTTTLQQVDREIERKVERNDGGLIVLRRSVVTGRRPQPHFGFPALERGHGSSFSAPKLAIDANLKNRYPVLILWAKQIFPTPNIALRALGIAEIDSPASN